MDSRSNQLNNQLDDVLYQQLKSLARKMMSKERSNHTLSATDLVHEAFAKLAPANLSFNDQKHYFYTFARQMRRVLLNYAKKKNAQKNQAEVLLWTESMGVSQQMMVDFETFDDAIKALESMDKRSSQAIELVYFTDISQVQASDILGVSLATLERDLKFGRVVIQEYIENHGVQHE